MTTEPVHSEKYKGYTIKIVPDDDPQNPRECDNLGTMVCWHPQYILGDERPRHHLHDWLEDQLALDIAQANSIYERISSNLASWRQAHEAYMAELLSRFRKHAVVLPLYLYDHSGITMNTTGFHCPWDSGQVGLIHVSLDKVRKEWGVKRVSKKLRRKVEAVLTAEVSAYDDYLRGNVYGFVIEKDGECVDSCWGFDGDYEDYCLIEARRAADHAERQALPLLDTAGLLDAQGSAP